MRRPSSVWGRLKTRPTDCQSASHKRPLFLHFTGERRRALLHGRRAGEQGDNWAQQSSAERFVEDAFRQVKQATADTAMDEAADTAMAKGGPHWATPRTAVHKSKTENRSNSTWLDMGSRN